MSDATLDEETVINVVTADPSDLRADPDSIIFSLTSDKTLIITGDSTD
jgi:hypothetical protein